jgi:TRAP-type C4-dicarboxylate transport system substrate-binding protein
MKIMRECDRDVQEKTGGKLKFRFYPGGVLGDEQDANRKIRLGQLHSAGFSGVGFGAILPDVRISTCRFCSQPAGSGRGAGKNARIFAAEFLKRISCC